MFTNKDKETYDNILESIENMGESIGVKVHKSGSWVIKYIVMGSLVLFFGVIVFIATMVKRAVGSKK